MNEDKLVLTFTVTVEGTREEIAKVLTARVPGVDVSEMLDASGSCLALEDLGFDRFGSDFEMESELASVEVAK